MSAKETASGEKHRMKENADSGATVREDDRMTHRGQHGLFWWEPLSAGYMHALLRVCSLCLSLACQANSVVTGALEPHGGQPCKEHKRPI